MTTTDIESRVRVDRKDFGSTDSVRAAIEARLGECPAFFDIAGDSPSVMSRLWRRMEEAVLDSPIPRSFAERAFAYLSRFCDVPYCLAWRTASMLTHVEPLDIVDLLEQPVPSDAELRENLAWLQSLDDSGGTWPRQDDEAVVFRCLIPVFLQRGPFLELQAELRRALGARHYDALIDLLGFVRDAHYWTQTHRSLVIDVSIRARIDEHPDLSAWIDSYVAIVGEEVAEADGAESRPRIPGVRESSIRWTELQRWARLFANSPNPAFIKDLSGNIVDINGAAESRLGWSREELVGKSIKLVLPRVEYAMFEDLMARCARGDVVPPVETANVTRDGDKQPALVTLSLLTDEAGEAVGLASVAVDISERKRAEEDALFLQGLQGYTVRERDCRALVREVLRSLAEHFDVDHAALLDFDANGNPSRLRYARRDPDGFVDESASRFSSDDFVSRDARDAIRAGSSFVVSDVVADARTSMHADALRRLDIAAVLTEPCVTVRGLEMVLVLSSRRPRVWNDGERRLLLEVAVRLFPAIERVRAEESLRDSEERLRLFVRHAPAAVAMFDREMRCLVASQRWLEDSRLEDRDVIGSVYYDIVPDLPERWKAVHRQCLAGQIMRCDEDLIIQPDGRREWVEWECRPWRDAAGRIGGIVLFAELITDKKVMMEELRDREARLRAIVDHAIDALVSIDHEGTIESFNPAAEAMFGYSVEEVVGQNISLLMPSPHREQHAKYIATYLRTREPKILGIGREVMAKKKDGTIFPIDLGISELVVDGKRKFSGIVRDLTEQNRVHAEYVRAQKMEAVARLSAGVAHDFNNLLAGVLGGLRIATKSLDEGHPAMTILTEIQQEVRRGASVTRRLLDYSRSDSAQLRPIAPEIVIREAEPMIRRYLGEDIKVSVSCRTAGKNVVADAAMLEQALLNLVINARDAMPNGGTLTLSCAVEELSRDELQRVGSDRDPGSFVVFSVEDTGIGMDESTLRRAEEAFFTTKGPGEGTGLGLSTVTNMLRNWGGFLRLESRIGIGTTASVYLPATMGSTEESRTDTAKPEVETTGGATILVVEDEKLVRRGIEHVLTERDYSVIGASNPNEALDVLRERGDEIDVVLTDVILPGMSGPELVEAARTFVPGLPALFMSAFPHEDLVARGRLDPSARSLAKPFSNEELFAKLHEALGRHP
ncbi:MAG: PAS domain S-box protein [Planctomycetes bacterium]|nr:PAS domain S-box protein [Planctomycetota bacterium]